MTTNTGNGGGSNCPRSSRSRPTILQVLHEFPDFHKKPVKRPDDGRLGKKERKRLKKPPKNKLTRKMIEKLKRLDDNGKPLKGRPSRREPPRDMKAPIKEGELHKAADIGKPSFYSIAARDKRDEAVRQWNKAREKNLAQQNNAVQIDQEEHQDEWMEEGQEFSLDENEQIMASSSIIEKGKNCGNWSPCWNETIASLSNSDAEEDLFEDDITLSEGQIDEEQLFSQASQDFGELSQIEDGVNVEHAPEIIPAPISSDPTVPEFPEFPPESPPHIAPSPSPSQRIRFRTNRTNFVPRISKMKCLPKSSQTPLLAPVPFGHTSEDIVFKALEDNSQNFLEWNSDEFQKQSNFLNECSDPHHINWSVTAQISPFDGEITFTVPSEIEKAAIAFNKTRNKTPKKVEQGLEFLRAFDLLFQDFLARSTASTNSLCLSKPGNLPITPLYNWQKRKPVYLKGQPNLVDITQFIFLTIESMKKMFISEPILCPPFPREKKLVRLPPKRAKGNRITKNDLQLSLPHDYDLKTNYWTTKQWSDKQKDTEFGRIRNTTLSFLDMISFRPGSKLTRNAFSALIRTVYRAYKTSEIAIVSVRSVAEYLTDLQGFEKLCKMIQKRQKEGHPFNMIILPIHNVILNKHHFAAGIIDLLFEAIYFYHPSFNEMDNFPNPEEQDPFQQIFMKKMKLALRLARRISGKKFSRYDALHPYGHPYCANSLMTARNDIDDGIIVALWIEAQLCTEELFKEIRGTSRVQLMDQGNFAMERVNYYAQVRDEALAQNRADVKSSREFNV